jgi:hypothetical protein
MNTIFGGVELGIYALTASVGMVAVALAVSVAIFILFSYNDIKK